MFNFKKIWNNFMIATEVSEERSFEVVLRSFKLVRFDLIGNDKFDDSLTIDRDSIDYGADLVEIGCVLIPRKHNNNFSEPDYRKQ